MKSERVALRVVQSGAVAIALVVTTLNAFELDRYFVPKELVLHIAAVVACAFAARAILRASITTVDLILVVYLLMSAVSAAMATNRWLSIRSLAISASSLLLFWVARGLRESGLGRALLSALAVAIVVVAATALLQTYGLDSRFFSLNRAPGGTLGNRNFVAHVAAFGLPLLLLATLRAHRTRTYFLCGIGMAIVTAALVLTRSRAAWLAFVVVLILFAAAMLLSPVLRRDPRIWRRLAGVACVSAAAVGAALSIPNSLRWRSDDPYLESVRHVADYGEGSGRGRLIQYARSLPLAAQYPLLGVGPGNWPVVYPATAPRDDPSLNDSELGMTLNPWPSSDWIACLTERGFSATAALLFAFVLLAGSGWRRLRTAVDPDEALGAAVMLGTIAAVVIAGTFDAVLILALPAYLVWTALGALWTPQGGIAVPMRRLILFAVLAISLGGAVRSTAQLLAMDSYATRADRASLERAARIDPGNYRLRIRLARNGPRAERCSNARAAHALFPSARAAAELARGCH